MISFTLFFIVEFRHKLNSRSSRSKKKGFELLYKCTKESSFCVLNVLGGSFCIDTLYYIFVFF